MVLFLVERSTSFFLMPYLPIDCYFDLSHFPCSVLYNMGHFPGSLGPWPPWGAHLVGDTYRRRRGREKPAEFSTSLSFQGHPWAVVSAAFSPAREAFLYWSQICPLGLWALAISPPSVGPPAPGEVNDSLISGVLCYAWVIFPVPSIIFAFDSQY